MVLWQVSLFPVRDSLLLLLGQWCCDLHFLCFPVFWFSFRFSFLPSVSLALLLGVCIQRILYSLIPQIQTKPEENLWRR